jgi:hypothetical protein
MKRLLAAAFAFATPLLAQGITVILTDANFPACQNGQPVVLAYSGVDVDVQGPVHLRCDTVIQVTGGDLTISGHILGHLDTPPNRPPGTSGNPSYSLTLITKCGPRLAIGTPPPNDDDPTDQPPTTGARAYCGNISISGLPFGGIELIGEDGVGGAPGDGAGTGFPGGNGGNGGKFKVEGVHNISFGHVATTGGNSGAGGPGGLGCDPQGEANGGEGGVPGDAGTVNVSHVGAVAHSLISMGVGAVNTTGGSAGKAGDAGPGSPGGCGATGGSGGSAFDGGAGGSVSVTGLRVSIWGTSCSEAIFTNGGYGAGGGAGGGGGGSNCSFLLLDPCIPPVNGGPASASHKGGPAGSITVASTEGSSGPNDPGSLTGMLTFYAVGGVGGDGASGGNGGEFVNPSTCLPICQGSGGETTDGSQGGHGGTVTISSPWFSYTACLDVSGGWGGIGTQGSSGHRHQGCNVGGQGGNGGAGGDPGLVVFTGTQATNGFTYAMIVNHSGNGGSGGDAGCNGYLHGTGAGCNGPGQVVVNTVPPFSYVLSSCCSGLPSVCAPGSDGQDCPCIP